MLPDFKENTLPPYLGFPTSSALMSPFSATMQEFVERFGTTLERIKLLEGLLAYRARLYAYGITGFQWLSGSFVENVEVIRNRPPGDVDVISIIYRPAGYVLDDDWNTFSTGEVDDLLFKAELMKETYQCDAYTIDMNDPALQVVDSTRFWFGLFTHQKLTDNWKGIVAVELSEQQDADARTILSQVAASLAI